MKTERTSLSQPRDIPPAARASLQGYVLDDVYPSIFHPEFTPNWIDAMLRHRGMVPPRRSGEPFSMMDLGCGDGLGLIVVAAAHPEGRFVGVDALPAHAEIGTRVAASCGVSNVSFRRALFSDLEDPPVPAFDYVTAQGVMSWVGAGNQQHVRRIAASHLRPGGIFCVGYNALPGWKDALALQQMVRMIADELSGDAVARFDAAVERIRAMGAAGAAVFAEPLLEWLDGLRARLPAAYFPHEYLNRHWAAYWSAEMIEATAAHGFTFAGPGRADRLRDDFCLKAAQRREIARLSDPLARETAADIFLLSAFRVDLYDRAAERSATPEEARLDGWWAATEAAGQADYACRTPAGTLKFDNDAARAILSVLEKGPSTLRAVHAEGNGGTHEEVLNGADALFVAGLILPAGPPTAAPAAGAVNRHVRRAVEEGRGINALAGRHGPMPVAVTAIDPAKTEGEKRGPLQMLERLGIG